MSRPKPRNHIRSEFEEVLQDCREDLEEAIRDFENSISFAVNELRDGLAGEPTEH